MQNTAIKGYTVVERGKRELRKKEIIKVGLETNTARNNTIKIPIYCPV
jgi:hypothetical protein